MSATSLRQLAEHLQLSHATVSEALRGSPRVKTTTRLRVVQAAEALGYRRNPLASALMGEMRRSRGGTFRGSLVLLDCDGPRARDDDATRHHAGLVAGAKQQAEAQGFKIDEIMVDRAGNTLERLTDVLEARGIQGVLVLPCVANPDLRCIDWSRFTGIYADGVTDDPRLNTICPDYHRGMVTALRQIRALGYRRPGLALDASLGARHLHRWAAAYHGFFLGEPGFDIDAAPPRPFVFHADDHTGFQTWFRDHAFDVVLAHRAEVRDWMRAAGAIIGETHGFCALRATSEIPGCAGLDLRPHTLGRRAMEMLTEQVVKNEFGEPETPTTTLIPPRWIDGPSLRSLHEVAAA